MRIAGAFIVWTAFIFICGAAVYAGSEKDAITPGTEEQRGFINDNVITQKKTGTSIFRVISQRVTTDQNPMRCSLPFRDGKACTSRELDPTWSKISAWKQSDTTMR